MSDERFYGLPREEVDKARAEGREIVPIGRDVPWSVTESIMEVCIPDPERRLQMYVSILELLRKESAIPKRFFEITPESVDTSLKVVNLDAYRKNRQNLNNSLE